MLCSAAVGTVPIGYENDLEGETEPKAAIGTTTLVQDGADGFVTLEVTSMQKRASSIVR
ncbi:hypothetical protein [Natronorubrum tibetense]|uniref:hypothetical protein n=1 Tax=Natronorubrum tibetense TaxID=63128 RepID=UPI00037B8588|nr:hypothetical protein [Natronorubrum tibetense]